MTRLSALVVIGLAGCGLVLDEPTGFSARPDVAQDAAPQPDAAALPDIGPDVPPPVDKGPDSRVRDAQMPDVGADVSPPDGSAPVDMAEAANHDLGPDAVVDAGCVAVEETCNGADDDCDGEVDEQRDLELCAPCWRDAEGVCGRGVTWCEDGVPTCVVGPSPPGEVPACDLLDNDCDGALDEGEEAWPEVAADVAARCPAPEAEACEGGVGCGAHPCVEPGCLSDCLEARAAAFAACRLADEVDCETGFAECVQACEAGAATRWSCAESADGPVCLALDCPEPLVADGRLCVPRVEVCNNGVDDDDDGLVDGTVGAEDPCMVAVDATANAGLSGVCDQLRPGCEDSVRMLDGDPAYFDSFCYGEACPRRVTLDYRYAVDREEVSIRAYSECVASGCCLPPTGRTFQLAQEALDAARADERCAPTVDALNPEARTLLPDLPVTGVTWCQARDYCAWVGKRLVTDYEWERAAAGWEAARRIYPWGDARPGDCPENQCCARPDFDGEAPGLCEGGLLECRENIPANTRLACAAVYGFDSPNCSPILGPAPVYANADGDTPEGLRNMGGNVSEWVFDWAGEELATISRHNPVGPACDRSFFSGKRHIRGGAYTGVGDELRTIERTSMFAQVRAPTLGFRCGRTLPEGDGVCDPRTPEVPAVCHPGADVRADREGALPGAACAAPDFVAAPAEDRDECPGILGREGSRECTEGLADFCATERQLDCGTFVLSRMRLPFGQVDNQSWAGIANTIFDTTLAPVGGPTIFALDLPANFDNINREWNATIGSAALDADGRLAWLGTLDGGLCDVAETLRFPIRTVQGQRTIRPVCGATGRMRMAFRDAPASLVASAIGLNARFEPAAQLISGTLVIVVTVQDTEDSTFGPSRDQGIGRLAQQIGLQPLNLCGATVPFVSPDCAAQPLIMPGCVGNECRDPRTCTGYFFPFEFEAVRSTDAGIVGFDGCE